MKQFCLSFAGLAHRSTIRKVLVDRALDDLSKLGMFYHLNKNDFLYGPSDYLFVNFSNPKNENARNRDLTSSSWNENDSETFSVLTQYEAFLTRACLRTITDFKSLFLI
jgi:hypothetical protein